MGQLPLHSTELRAQEDDAGPRSGLRSARFAPNARQIAQRKLFVHVAKRTLPAVAVLLLCLVVLWPEFNRDNTSTQALLQAGVVLPKDGEMALPHYNGVDQNSHPYTVTATSAIQTTSDRIDLVAPIADITMSANSWMRGEGRVGVYIQSTGQLDLDGNVTLYRDDGVMMQTDTATIDTKSGAVTSAAKVHVEGPFGTLDAQGFALLDHGAVVQFNGPGRLLLNGTSK